MYSGPFGCLTKPSGKRVELVQKFVPRSCIRIFYNKRTQSTPLDPKLTFWCVLYHLGAFGTVWLPYETRCKTCRTSAKARATKSHRNFSQQTITIQPIGSQTDVFGVFYIIWVHSGPFGCLMKLGGKRAELVQKSYHEIASEFFPTNAPDPLHWNLN